MCSLRRYLVMGLVVLGLGRSALADPPTTGPAQPAQPAREAREARGAQDAREARVDQLLAGAQNGPGAAILVARDGQVLLKKAYGLANLEHRVPNTPQTRFRIGSITKSFTAIAILQLQEKGLLRLDDAVARYLPDCPNAERFTIRHLLTHTSGMDDAHEGQLASAPGKRLAYSNAGYNLLGRVIEKVSGVSYEQYLHQNILSPLKMASSGMDHAQAVLEHRAAGYVPLPGGGYRNADYIDMTGPYASGGMYSTVEDLYLLDQALYGQQLLSAQTIRQAFTPVRLNDGSEGAYGFGWLVGRYRGVREISHGGDINGFNGFLARYPDQRLVVIVLCNSQLGGTERLPLAWQIAHQISDIYLEEHLTTAPVVATADPKLYDEYAGKYRIDGPPELVAVLGNELLITREGDKLMAQDKSAKVQVLPESATVFAAHGSPIKLKFVRDQQGKVHELVLGMLGVREFHAPRAE